MTASAAAAAANHQWIETLTQYLKVRFVAVIRQDAKRIATNSSVVDDLMMQSEGGGRHGTDDGRRQVSDGTRGRSKADPSVIVAVPHGLVAGLVWAIDDHVDHWKASLGVVINELRLQHPDEDAPTLYAMWCLVDALLKYSKIAALRASLESSLPQLVSQRMPLLRQCAALRELDDDAPSAASLMPEDRTRPRRPPHGSSGGPPSNREQPEQDTSLLEPHPCMWVFLDLLRSWILAKLLRPSDILRLEEHMAHRLSTAFRAALVAAGRNGLTRSSGRGGGGGQDALVDDGEAQHLEGAAAFAKVKQEPQLLMPKLEPGLQGNARVLSDLTEKAQAIAKVVAAMKSARLQSEGDRSSVSARKNGGRPQFQSLTGAAATLGFARDLHHPDRIAYACCVCGAYFENPTARDTHARVHTMFIAPLPTAAELVADPTLSAPPPGSLSPQTLYRMPLMSRDDFLDYTAVLKRDGVFHRNFATVSDVSRAVRSAAGSLGQKRSRPLDAKAASTSATSEGASYVAVTDPMATYRCCRCKLQLTPEWVVTTGGASGNVSTWGLRGCVAIPDEGGVAHTDCL